MELKLHAIQATLTELIRRAKEGGEPVSRREGEVNIRLLSTSFGHMFEVQIFSNLLFGGSKIWADHMGLEILVEKVHREIEYLVKEEMKYPLKNILNTLDIE